jgi:hypothetical protein
MADAAADELDLIEVSIVGMPLDLFTRAQEHQEGINREFALINAGDWEPPARLQQLISELEEQFEAFTARPTAEREAAMQRREPTVDLRYHVPALAREAALQLGQLLDEVDDYCRRGQLLSMAMSDELVVFRRWFLAQFVDQIEGKPAVSWQQWRERRPA